MKLRPSALWHTKTTTDLYKIKFIIIIIQSQNNVLKNLPTVLLTNVVAIPVFPQRPVRPILCTEIH